MHGMKALDLFCCGGGASDGLARAGFDVTGVDIRRYPNYPYTFIEADAVTLDIDLSAFDFIWASPPCQEFSPAAKARGDYDADNYPDVIEPIRRKLAGHPWTCIENVMGAPIRADLVLTGPSVGLDRIERRRKFELSFFVINPPAPPPRPCDVEERPRDHDNEEPFGFKSFLSSQGGRSAGARVAAGGV